MSNQNDNEDDLTTLSINDTTSIHTTDFLSTTTDHEDMKSLGPDSIINTPKPKHQLKSRRPDEDLITDATSFHDLDATEADATPRAFRKSQADRDDLTSDNTLTPVSTRRKAGGAADDLQTDADAVSMAGTITDGIGDIDLKQDSISIHSSATIPGQSLISDAVDSTLKSATSEADLASQATLQPGDDSISLAATSIVDESKLVSQTDDTISQNSSTLHAPASESINSEDYNVSSVANSSAKNAESASLAGDDQTMADNVSLKSQASKISKSEISTNDRSEAKTLSSVGASIGDSIADSKMTKGLDSISVTTDTLHSSALGAPDSASISGSQMTGHEELNSRQRRKGNNSDAMSYQDGLSRAPSMLSVTSSGQMSSVSQSRRSRDKQSNLYSQYGQSDTASMHSSSSKQTTNTTASMKVSRIQAIYNSVYQGISDYTSIFTAELNVLQTQLLHDSTPDEAKHELEDQLKSTERILSQLNYQQSQATEIYEQYKIQEKYREGQEFKKGQLEISPVSKFIIRKMKNLGVIQEDNTVSSHTSVPTSTTPKLSRTGSIRRKVFDKSSTIMRSGSIRVKNPGLHKEIKVTKQNSRRCKEVRSNLRGSHRT